MWGGGWISSKLLSWGGVFHKWKWVMRFLKICNRGPPYNSVPRSTQFLDSTFVVLYTANIEGSLTWVLAGLLSHMS